MARLKNALILALLFVIYVFRGKANRRVSSPKAILIIQLAKLGDMVCTTPMFRAIKKKYPNSKVVVMGLPHNAEILRGNIDVDEYISYSGSPLSLWRKIKAGHFDFACVVAPNFIPLALLYLSRIPSISSPIVLNGFSPYATRAYKIISSWTIQKPHNMGSYAPREYLRLLEPIDIHDEETSKRLSFSSEALDQVNKFLNDLKPGGSLVIGMAPGAGHKIKQWPPERFAKLADYVIEKYQAKVVLVGGSNDKEEGEELLNNMKNKEEVTTAVNRFSIDELKALISKLDLFIGADTGPIYIAEAFKVPTIDIVGPVDENEQPPRGELHAVVVAKRNAPAMHILNARQLNWVEARRQVEAITTEMVISATDEIIRRISK